LILANYKKKKMSSQAVMKRQILALAKREPSNEELQKIKQSLAVYKKLTKEEQSKINEMVKDAHAKLESEGKFAKGGTTKTQSLKTALTDLKNKVGVKKFKRATTGTDIKKDIAIPALKGGKRIVRKKGKTSNQFGTFKNQVGTTYYESRSNRSDVNQPSEKRKIKLADGGQFSDFNPKSFTLGELKEMFRNKDIELQYLRKGDVTTNSASRDMLWKSSDKITKFADWKLTISDYGQLSMDKGDENLYLSLIVYKDNESQPMELQIYTKDNHQGLKDFSQQIIKKFAKGGEMDKKSAKFKVGDKVYSYQNKSESAPIAYVKFSAWDSENGAHPNDVWKYKLSLKDGYSNWINEESLSKRPKKKYAKGGEVGNVDYNEILPILKDKLEDAITDLPNKYETSYTFNGEEVESKSRDGFIAYTDGGYEVRWFEQISYFSGSGNNLPTKALDNEMQRQVDQNYEYAKDRFKDEYSEIVEELGEENLDYNSLYEAGYESEAEQLSEWENDYDSEGTIMCEIGAYYYSPDNSRGIEDKHTIRLFGLVNLESPYHRSGNLEDRFDIDITFNSIAEMEEKLEQGLKEIIDWFDGSKYSESTKELKIVRMAKGGQLKSKAKYIPNRNIDEIEVTRNGKTTSIDGANLLDGVYVKKGTKFAKGGKISKQDALQKAIDMGVDFDKDFHAQSFGNELAELAKESGYKKSPSSSGSTGRAFFYHLQKIYNDNKMRKATMTMLDKDDNGFQHYEVKFAKGGQLKSKAKYIPNRNIDEIEVTRNGKTTSIDGANLLDGVYVKKGTKFAKGGNVSNTLDQKIKHINEKYNGVVASKTERDNRIQVVSPFFNTLNEIKRNEFDGNGLLQKDVNSNAYVLYSNAVFAKGGTIKKSLAEFKNKVGASKYREATRGVDIKADLQIPALKKGRRVVTTKGKTSNQYGTFKNKVGSVYYENRPNHYDVNQPSEKRKIKLADGGEFESLKVGSKVGFLRPQTGRYQYAEVLSIDGNNVNLVVRHPKKVYLDNYFTETKKRISKFLNTSSKDWKDGRPVVKIKYAKGGTFADGGVLESAKIYVADLAEYNDGRLVGKWFDFSDYSDASELMIAIQEMLDEQTAKDKHGEVHEEWAVHDFEGFPRSFYSEYMGEKDFEKLYQIAEVANDRGLPIDVLMEAVADFGADEDQIERIAEAYYISIPASMGNESRDFAYEYIDSIGSITDAVSNPDFYFDYESFGSDARMDYTDEELEEYGYDELDDTELGERLVDEMGGIEQLGNKTIEMYFDYDKFGRDLEYDFTAVRGDDGNFYYFSSNW
jgi:antirestriction protein